MSQHFTVDALTDVPVILSTVHEGFTIADDQPAFMTRVIECLEAATQPQFLVTDTRLLSANLSDLLDIAAPTGRLLAALRQTAIREICVVSNSAIVKMIAQGMQAPLFGGLPMRNFDSVEEALSYCREKAAASG